MSAPSIVADQIAKSFSIGQSTTAVLRNVTFDVSAGECLLLVGPSGSGKTTLLSILGCVLSADAGRLSLCGEDVTRLKPREQARFRRERIGFVFQRYHLFRGLSAWENVRVALDLLGVPKSQGKQEALQLLEAVGLADRTGHQINQLSMGQRQRVAIARALAGGPEIILADEPTASLDAVAGQQVMRLLTEIGRQTGKTVVIVTHDSRVFEYGDRILTLSDGCVEESSTPANTPANESSPYANAIGAA